MTQKSQPRILVKKKITQDFLECVHIIASWYHILKHIQYNLYINQLDPVERCIK